MSLTIDDLKYHELRQILSYLSVRQLFNSLTVSQKWYQIITELLDSQKVLSLQNNDINEFTKEEMNQKCNNWRHLAVKSSVGRVIGGKSSLMAAFVTPSFNKIRPHFLRLSDFCPNVLSLDLRSYCLQMSDLDILLDQWSRLQCLSITTDEVNWTKFLCPKVAGLKHFSVTLTTKTPIYGVHEKPLQFLEYRDKIQLENLVMIDPEFNQITLNILNTFLRLIVPNLKKCHLTPTHPMSEFEALDLINSLKSSPSVVHDLNIFVFVFNDFLEAIESLVSLETLYIHISNIESQTNPSLKKLKNLRKIHLNFYSNINALRGRGEDSTNQFISILSHIPPTLEILTLYDATLSISAFTLISNHLTKLQEMDLIYVIIEDDCQHTFWEVISNFKSLRSLTLDTTDIRDDGIQYLLNCQSLRVLELVKYKGPSAQTSLIDSMKVIEFFGQMASLLPNEWFDLRLDIDVFEVTQHSKRLVPKNVRLINVGFKK